MPISYNTIGSNYTPCSMQHTNIYLLSESISVCKILALYLRHKATAIKQKILAQRLH